MPLTARPSERLDAPPFNSPPSVPDLLSQRHELTEQIAVLERDLRSLRARTRALITARSDMAPPMAVVGTFAKGRTVDAIVQAAKTCEALGTVPAIRFVRNEAQQITGVELAILADAAQPIDDGFRALVALGGMAVVRG